MTPQRLSEIRALLTNGIRPGDDVVAALRDLLAHLSSVQPPDRVRAAQMNVIECAEALQAAERHYSLAVAYWTNERRKFGAAEVDDHPSRDASNAAAMACSNAVDRLRDLRANLSAEECRRIGPAWAPVILADMPDGPRVYPKCNQSRGHVGDCMGPLPDAKWHENGSGEFGQ